MENIDFAKHILKMLKDALRSDPKAMNTLLNQRVFCNEVLAQHQNFQVIVSQDDAGNPIYIVSMLGIFNGVLDAMDAPVISAIVNDTQGIVGFSLYDLKKQELIEDK